MINVTTVLHFPATVNAMLPALVPYIWGPLLGMVLKLGIGKFEI